MEAVVMSEKVMYQECRFVQSGCCFPIVQDVNFFSICFCASYSVSSTGAYPVSQLEDICLAERYFKDYLNSYVQLHGWTMECKLRTETLVV